MKKSPYLCYNGNELFEGDSIVHPSGQTAKIIYMKRPDRDPWMVYYNNDIDDISTLCLQFGDKGQARKIL